MPQRPKPKPVPFRWSDIIVSKVGSKLIIVGDDVTRQELATPHIAADGSLALAYGTEDCTPQTVCDRIYAIKDRKATQVIAYLPREPQCLNYLGAGAALAVHDGRYFALLQVMNERKAWLAWAMSTDGLYWQMLSASGGWTTDPLHSMPVIYRSDLEGGSRDGYPRFWHNAMVFNGADFDVCIGYNNTIGLYATWWRIQYDPLHGGLGAISRLYDGQYVPGAVVPDDESWAPHAQWPPNAVDPHEIVRIDGRTLFFYGPVENAFDSPTPIAWARFGQRPNLLDTSKIYEKWSPAPGNPAGNAISVYQSGPMTLSGYIAVSPDPPPLNCRQGLLEIELTLV